MYLGHLKGKGGKGFVHVRLTTRFDLHPLLPLEGEQTDFVFPLVCLVLTYRMHFASNTTEGKWIPFCSQFMIRSNFLGGYLRGWRGVVKLTLFKWFKDTACFASLP